MAIWREYIENAYISCFHYLVNRKLHWSERIFWLITIVTCMGCAFYVVSGSLIIYKKQRVAFEVDTAYPQWKTPFPSIVFCEKRAAATSDIRNILLKYIDKMKLDVKYSSDMKLHIHESAFIIPPNNIGSTFPTICTEDPSNCQKLNYTEVAGKVRGSCTSLLDYCSYNGVNFTCCDEFLPVNTAYGKCFAFNNYGARYPNGSRVTWLKWRIVRGPGLGLGNLKIITQHKHMFVSVLGPNSVPNLKNERNIFQNSHSTFLTEKTEYIYHARIEQTRSLVEDKHILVEYKGCRLPHENNLKYFNFYSEANCEIECFMKAQKELCKCVGHFCPVDPGEQCDINGLKCLADIENAEKFPALKCECLPDCNSIHVNKVGTIIKSGNPYFNPKKNKNKFILQVIVPAPTLKYIRYTPTTELDLIVSIGGTVSFFLGVSFLSIIQMLYYFFVRALADWYRREKDLKRMTKERRMDENFATARRKLKLAKIEADIKDKMRKRTEKYYSVEGFEKEKNE